MQNVFIKKKQQPERHDWNEITNLYKAGSECMETQFSTYEKLWKQISKTIFSQNKYYEAL